MKITIDIPKEELRIEPDGDLWSAYCDKLGLDSFGTTKQEAEVNLGCVISLYFKALMERGILLKRIRG